MMDQLNFVKNGVLRLPPGFRFHPTDEELVVQYLKRKVLSCPLPAASIIPELALDVCNSDPWDLPGNLQRERYFFSIKQVKYPNGNRSNRATSSGYWKATGVDKHIVASRSHQVVGIKKTLVFYRGKPPHGIRTDWIMHEYRLPRPHTPAAAAALQPNDFTPAHENLVICRIFLKKRSGKSEDDEMTERHCCGIGVVAASEKRNNGVVYYDFMAKDRKNQLRQLAPVSSSSGSSGITEISYNGRNDHEENSSCNSFSPPRRELWL